MELFNFQKEELQSFRMRLCDLELNQRNLGEKEVDRWFRRFYSECGFVKIYPTLKTPGDYTCFDSNGKSLVVELGRFQFFGTQTRKFFVSKVGTCTEVNTI